MLKFNIPHAHINGLLFILNRRLNNVLSKDARTLLKTNKETVQISESPPGMYWRSVLYDEHLYFILLLHTLK